jgi:hypothetical protein
VDIGGLEGYYGHFEYDAKKQNIKMMRKFSEIKSKNRFYLENSIKFVNGLIKNKNLSQFVVLFIFLNFGLVNYKY